MKSSKQLIRKTHMELLKNTTDLIGLKDKHIKILFVLQHQTHIEIQAKLDYQAPDCPYCQASMIKYDFQKASAIPILDIQGRPSVIKLKKRHFQCKDCRRVAVSETPLVQRNCQISKPVWPKITQLHTEKVNDSAIAKETSHFRLCRSEKASTIHLQRGLLQTS